MENFLCGGLAAAMSICLVNPFDVVKSRLQMQGEHGKVNAHMKGVFRSLEEVARLEGVRGLYRGLLPAILFQATGNSTRFGVYHLGKRWAGVDDERKLDHGTNFLLATLAGVVAGVAACPMFVLKTQFQVQSSAPELATGHQHQHRNLRQAVVHIAREHGLRRFWVGLDAFLPRVIALVSVQLSTYDAVKHFLKREGLLREGPVCHLVASTVASACATIAMQPFDLVASRVMNQPMVHGVPQYYRGPWDCAVKTVRADGFLGLYRGGLANYLRVGPHYIFTFIFFEQLKARVFHHPVH